MKAFFLLIISLSFSLAVFGQADSLGFINKAEAKNLMVNGLKEGKWVEYLQHDSDFHITSDTNAPYFQLATYKSGKLSGIVNIYRKQGDESFKKPYVNGIENGIERWSGISEDDELYITETPYKDGNKNGFTHLRRYYRTGELESETFPINGDTSWVERFYYKSGELLSEATYVRDTLIGALKYYSKNGRIRMERIFQHGDMLEQKYYDENGREIKNGKFRWYQENGKLRYETIIKNGEEEGTINYDENGNEIK